MRWIIKDYRNNIRVNKNIRPIIPFIRYLSYRRRDIYFKA